jgi:PAS domain S-box-containing protein
MADNADLSSEEMGERFDLLATNAKEYALFLMGLDGKILCWNAGAEQTFGYASNEIVGHHFSRFFRPRTRSPARPSMSSRPPSPKGELSATVGRFARMAPVSGARLS